MGHNRHRHPDENRRRELRSPISGVAVRHVSLRGTLVNLSGRGIAIETSMAPRIGDCYRIELVGLAFSFSVDAIVRWCRLHAIRPAVNDKDFVPHFLAGLEFESNARLGEQVVATDRDRDPGTGISSWLTDQVPAGSR